MPQRLPIVDGDDGSWGTILNQYLSKEHYDTGVDNVANGGHKTITIRPGTTAANTAPLKFTSGSLMTTPEVGAVEFLTDNLYLTQTTGTARKVLATIDPTGAATGDIYYRNSSGQLQRLAIGSTNQVLGLSAGIPSWRTYTSYQTPTAVFGDGVSTSSVQVGTVCYVRVPYSGSITSWAIVSNAVASCTIDIWKSSAAVPTVANTITAAAKPTLATGNAGTVNSATLTGWTTTVASGDVFGFRLDALGGTAPNQITLTLTVASASGV